MAATVLNRLGRLTDAQRTSVDHMTSVSGKVVTASLAPLLLPIAVLRQHMNLSTRGLAIAPWRVVVTDFSVPHDDAYWAMFALAHSDVLDNGDVLAKWSWAAISDGYIRKASSYTGPTETLLVALQASNVASNLPAGVTSKVLDTLSRREGCPSPAMAPALMRNGTPGASVCTIHAAAQLRLAGGFPW